MKQIQMMKIGDVTPYENNPRNNDAAVNAVAESIRQFGFRQPIVVDANHVIIVGHTRLKAAQKLGLKEVPVLVADDLGEEQSKAYRLADNKTNELSSWNNDLLQQELAGIFDLDMSAFGFDASVLENSGEVKEDDFDEEPPEAPRTKNGEIWRLGAHQLMCGDATNQKDVRKLLGGGKADLYLTDPPYNINYTGKTKNALKIQNDNKTEGEFLSFLEDAFGAAKDNLKPGGCFYIWHADTEGLNFRMACKDVGWQVRECLIWSKDVFTLGRQDYQWQHEPCLYGWNEGSSHIWYSDRKQTTILKFNRPKRSEKHPTMKPIPLFDYLIKNSTKSGDIVLDTFAGSGTSIMACEQNGRNCYSMEIDPKYCDVIIDRFEAFTGKKAELMGR